MTAYEDVLYYLCGKNVGCRGNVDPQDSKLKDPIERAQLARVFFEEGLGRTNGLCMPPRFAPLSGADPACTLLDEPTTGFSSPSACFLSLAIRRWDTGFRSANLFRGLNRKTRTEWSFDPDPFQERDKLPEQSRAASSTFSRRRRSQGLDRQPAASAAETKPKPARKGESSGVDFAAGHLRSGRAKESSTIFMPPVEYLGLTISISSLRSKIPLRTSICGW